MARTRHIHWASPTNARDQDYSHSGDQEPEIIFARQSFILAFDAAGYAVATLEEFLSWYIFHAILLGLRILV